MSESLPPALALFCQDVALGGSYGNFSNPKKYGINCTIPAVVSKIVGLSGISDELFTLFELCFFSKKLKNSSLISSTVFIIRLMYHKQKKITFFIKKNKKVNYSNDLRVK